MQAGLLLLVHGEVTDPDVDMFDRERVFIEKRLAPLLERVPDLKVVMEHITTKDAAEFVAQAPPNVAATITPQHMMLNRNALFVVSYGSLRLLATSCGICCTGAAPGDIMVPRHMLLSQNGSPVYEVMHLLALVCAPWALLSREQAGSLEPQCLHGQPAPQLSARGTEHLSMHFNCTSLELQSTCPPCAILCRVDCGPTTIACPFSRGSSTGRQWQQQLSVAAPSSSWALTAPLTHVPRRYSPHIERQLSFEGHRAAAVLTLKTLPSCSQALAASIRCNSNVCFAFWLSSAACRLMGRKQ